MCWHIQNRGRRWPEVMTTQIVLIQKRTWINCSDCSSPCYCRLTTRNMCATRKGRQLMRHCHLKLPFSCLVLRMWTECNNFGKDIGASILNKFLLNFRYIPAVGNDSETKATRVENGVNLSHSSYVPTTDNKTVGVMPLSELGDKTRCLVKKN